MAMTSVVPERSAPIMITGRSLSLIGMSRPMQGNCCLLLLGDFELSKPIDKVEELLRGCLPEARKSDLLQHRFSTFAGIKREERCADLCDLGLGNFRRGDQWHIRQIRASCNDPAAVLFPG